MPNLAIGLLCLPLVAAVASHGDYGNAAVGAVLAFANIAVGLGRMSR